MMHRPWDKGASGGPCRLPQELLLSWRLEGVLSVLRIQELKQDMFREPHIFFLAQGNFLLNINWYFYLKTSIF